MSPSLDRLPKALAGHAGYLLVRLGKNAQRLFSAAVSPLGLRPQLCDILLTLDERGAQSQVALSETLAIERAHLVALLDQLEALGHVRRAVDPADRRRHAVSLTDEGARAAKRVAELAAETERAVLEGLAAAERKQFRAMLRRLAEDADEGD